MFTIGWIQDGSEFLSNSFRHKFLWSSINKEKNTRFEIWGWGRCNYRDESYFFCLNHRVIDNTISTNKLCIICTHYHYPVNVLQQKSNLFGILRSFINYYTIMDCYVHFELIRTKSCIWFRLDFENLNF